MEVHCKGIKVLFPKSVNEERKWLLDTEKRLLQFTILYQQHTQMNPLVGIQSLWPSFQNFSYSCCKVFGLPCALMRQTHVNLGSP
jgi:hypothetical protein